MRERGALRKNGRALRKNAARGSITDMRRRQTRFVGEYRRAATINAARHAKNGARYARMRRGV